MAQVKREWLDNYNAEISKVSEQGQAALRQYLHEVDPSASPDVVRSAVLAIMDSTCAAASDMSAAVSASFYRGLRQRVLGGDLTAYIESGRDPVATEMAVRAILQKFFDGDYEGFEQDCLDRLDYEVKRAAARCTGYNVERDPYDGDVRWARVPTGDKTCDFCIMLASRGPVYLTEESAGAFDKFHPHCDCKVVPFFGTERAYSRQMGVRRRGTTMSIEGYDPDALYREYLGGKFGGGTPSHGSGSKRMSWHDAYEGGKVTMGSVGEVQRYIRNATSYENLFERIAVVDRELPYYNLPDSYIDDIRRECRDARKRLIDR